MGHNESHLSEQYKSLIYHFRLSADMATNQNEEFAQIILHLMEDYSTNTSKKIVKVPAMRS